MLAITHYTRLLAVLRPDRTHILWKGRIVESGGPELAGRLESTGYAEWVDADEPADQGVGRAARPVIDDIFGGPAGSGSDPSA